MTDLLKQAVISGENITLQVSAKDLREILGEMMQAERERIRKDEQKPTYSRKEASRILNVSYSTLNRWAKDEYLVPCKVGTKVLYKACDIEEVIKMKRIV
ncbi:MAG: helix-turn-helix domain-containing protein [Bacteroidales bacterium]|nr:helix-turn-helix domain-containing protein [Bacteroidales bacterium]